MTFQNLFYKFRFQIRSAYIDSKKIQISTRQFFLKHPDSSILLTTPKIQSVQYFPCHPRIIVYEATITHFLKCNLPGAVTTRTVTKHLNSQVLNPLNGPIAANFSPTFEKPSRNAKFPLSSHELQTCDWPRNVGCAQSSDSFKDVDDEALLERYGRKSEIYWPRR